jgi:hypothetical protein
MIGLCHSCRVSGIELELVEGRPVCKACIRRRKICDESNEMFKNGTQGEEIDI